MDFFTHFIVAVLFGNLFLKELSFEYVIFIGIMAIFPDLDVFIEPLKKVWKSYYILHRGASHSYITGIFISAIAAGIFSFFTRNPFLEAWFIGCIAFSLHVTLDLFTTSKVPAFFPFTRKEFRLSADRAINFAVAIPSIIILIFFGFRFFNLPIGFLFTNFANYYLIAYLSYFCYKLLLRLRIQTTLHQNQHYIPGVLPFSYMIYKSYDNDNMHVYMLTKRSVFSSNNLNLFDIHILNDSKTMQYLNKSLELSKDYRFFSKWQTMVPLINEKDNSIVVTLILGESLSRNRCYQLIVTFDKTSGNISSEVDGFNQLSEDNLNFKQ